jgi:hypothetical protein
VYLTLSFNAEGGCGGGQKILAKKANFKINNLGLG